MKQVYRLVFGVLVLTLGAAVSVSARPEKGDRAPSFELVDLDGNRHSSADFEKTGMSVLLFLSVESKPSRELALALSNLAEEHGDAGFRVMAVSADPRKKLTEFMQQHRLAYPLCTDESGTTLEQYGAAEVVPLTYVIAPDGSVGRVLAGGGVGPQTLLVALAEKELARGNAETAGDLFSKAAAADPEDVEARAGVAFALSRQGKLERAEQEFRDVGSLGGDGKRIEAEGLSEVALRRGDLEGARRAASKIGKDTAQSRLVRGEIAAQEGKLDEAKLEFKAAVEKPSDFDWQKAAAFTNLARISSKNGDQGEAVRDYDRAIREEPFSVEARSDKAVALERDGKLDEAKKAASLANALAPSDELVLTVLRRIEERQTEMVDLERQKLVNRLVDELATAFREGKVPTPPADEWSPRKLVVSFLDVRDQLGVVTRAGLADALLMNLTRSLQESGRVQVVEREILDKLLTELKLGSSELADPSTRLRLGRIFAASVIGTGALYPTGPNGQLELRLIDTETTEIRTTVSETLPSAAQVAGFAERLAADLSKTLRKAYPLRGKLAAVDGGEILVGVGAKHGATSGLRFQVVEQGEPVEVDGEVLGYRSKTIGTIELTKVEDGFARAKAIEGAGFSKGQRIVEHVQ